MGIPSIVKPCPDSLTRLSVWLSSSDGFTMERTPLFPSQPKNGRLRGAWNSIGCGLLRLHALGAIPKIKDLFVYKPHAIEPSDNPLRGRDGIGGGSASPSLGGTRLFFELYPPQPVRSTGRLGALVVDAAFVKALICPLVAKLGGGFERFH